MKASGISGTESTRPLTPSYGWTEKWERSTPDVTDGPVRRVAPAADTTPGAGRGTGPPGPPITTDLVPDLGADGTPPIGSELPNEDSRAIRYGENGTLKLSAGLLPTRVDRRA